MHGEQRPHAEGISALQPQDLAFLGLGARAHGELAAAYQYGAGDALARADDVVLGRVRFRLELQGQRVHDGLVGNAFSQCRQLPQQSRGPDARARLS